MAQRRLSGKDRRQFVRGLGAVVVTGFDPVLRRWAVADETAKPIPDLDGVVVLDEATLARTSSDEGNIVHRRPWAVLRPGSVQDIAMRFDDVGLAGFGLLFPIQRSRLTRRFLAVPETTSEWIYLFDVLTSAPLPGPNTRFVAEKLARNRRLYEAARQAGGTLYPISAVPMEPGDCAQQYGARYAEFAGLKHRHDPDRILTPGVRMF